MGKRKWRRAFRCCAVLGVLGLSVGIFSFVFAQSLPRTGERFFLIMLSSFSCLVLMVAVPGALISLILWGTAEKEE